jgi:rare lipoprotein A (peptidoglycan hydrolase)
MQDYKINGATYCIVKDEYNFSEIGLARGYKAQGLNGSSTTLGEQFDPRALDSSPVVATNPKLNAHYQPG